MRYRFAPSQLFRSAGLSLLELMLVLSIVTAMIIVSVRYYGNVTASKNVATAVSMVGSVRAGVDSYVSDRNASAIPSVSVLVADSYLPDIYSKGTPWGGTITTGGTVGGLMTIKVDSVPSASLCAAIQGQLLSTINTSLGETVTTDATDPGASTGSDDSPTPSSGPCSVTASYLN